MSRKTLAILASIILFFGIQVPPAKASMWRHWWVYYACTCSPCGPTLEGEWDLDCDGNYTGWGWEPGHSCTTTVTDSGPCDPPPP